jgi:hypothetical protein
MRTEAFLSHDPVPLEFTRSDFQQILAGNYIIKVIYLPNPQHQDIANTGLHEIVSTQLEPGADPIAEARRRGDILVIVRMGGIDMTAPKAASPKPEKPEAKPLDARAFIKAGRELLEQKKLAESQKVCDLAADSGTRWGLFEDNPDRLRADIAKATKAQESDNAVAAAINSQVQRVEQQVKAKSSMQPDGPVVELPRFDVKRTQIRFVGPAGMKIGHYTKDEKAHSTFVDNVVEAPGRYNYRQGAVYRLKLNNIEGHPGLELYPTLEVVPATRDTETYLAHHPVSVSFTDLDFHQVRAGKSVLKVFYLASPKNQKADDAEVGEIASTQLARAADLIAEALQRGEILAIVRMGGIDLEVPGAPAMEK